MPTACFLCEYLSSVNQFPQQHKNYLIHTVIKLGFSPTLNSPGLQAMVNNAILFLDVGFSPTITDWPKAHVIEIIGVSCARS